MSTIWPPVVMLLGVDVAVMVKQRLVIRYEIDLFSPLQDLFPFATFLSPERTLKMKLPPQRLPRDKRFS
jgi:hypothetical protein